MQEPEFNSADKVFETEQRKRRTKLTVRILVAVLSLLVVSGIVAAVLLIHRYYGLMDYQAVSSQDPVPEPVELEHILVVGLDKDDPEGGSRTDTIILVTVNPETEELTLTSFLRNLYVEIPGHGQDKLGYAYAKGGMELLQSTMQSNFDINIDRYVTIDFEAFRAIVDAIGGLELDLGETDLKYIFPGEEKEPGKYLLNGQQALVYAWWIEGGDDSGRTFRQRTIMTKSFEKIRTIPAEELDAMLVETLPKVTTDFTEGDCYSVLFGLAGLSKYPIRSQQVPFADTWETVVVDNSRVISFDLEENVRLFFESVE